MGHGWSKKPSEKRKRSVDIQKNPLPDVDEPLPTPPPDPDPPVLHQDHSSPVVTNKEIQQAISRGNVISAVFFLLCGSSSL